MSANTFSTWFSKEFIIMKILNLLLLVAVAYAKHEEYEGWKSYYVKPDSVENLTYLRSLDAKYDVDFLNYPTVNGEGLVLVKPQYQQDFLKTLDERNIPYKVHSENVASALRYDDTEIETRSRSLRRNGVRMPYDNYQRLEVFESYLEDIARRYPDKASLLTAAESFQGRPIKYLKVSTTNFTDPSKSVIMIDGGMHAREWIAPPTVTWAIHKLLENVTEPDLLDNFNFVLLPVVNPDGYEFSHTNTRWWRKTRSMDNTILSFLCRGVDGNRNFDIEWNTVGVDSDRCSEIYPGSEAFSEVETRAVGDLIKEHSSRMLMYLTMHSKGSLILYPWGHNASVTEHGPALQAVGVAMAEAIDNESLPHFPRYQVGNSAQVIGYETSGASEDYAHSVGVALTYTYELPGLKPGVQGFNLPPRYIEQVCRETWSGIVAGARKALELSLK